MLRCYWNPGWGIDPKCSHLPASGHSLTNLLFVENQRIAHVFMIYHIWGDPTTHHYKWTKYFQFVTWRLEWCIGIWCLIFMIETTFKSHIYIYQYRVSNTYSFHMNKPPVSTNPSCTDFIWTVLLVNHPHLPPRSSGFVTSTEPMGWS